MMERRTRETATRRTGGQGGGEAGRQIEGGAGRRAYREVVGRWARERELLGSVQPHTARKAQEKALLFEPWIGDGDVAEIEPALITEALIELGSTGGRRREGLSPTTLRAAHLAGSQALEWAIRNGLAERNPFKQVAKPKPRKKASRFLTPPQAASLADAMTRRARSCMLAGNVQQASFALAACIAVATGMRRGEIFALEWDDVDWARGRISVSRAVKAGGFVGDPKSASGVRSVAIGENLAGLLGEARAWHDSILPERSWPRPQLVVCNADGDIANLNTFEHWWKAWACDNGWEGLRFHDLRHTHATILISEGVDVKTVQMRLGHSSAEVTLSVYAHAMPLADTAAAGALDAALFG